MIAENALMALYPVACTRMPPANAPSTTASDSTTTRWARGSPARRSRRTESATSSRPQPGVLGCGCWVLGMSRPDASPKTYKPTPTTSLVCPTWGAGLWVLGAGDVSAGCFPQNLQPNTHHLV